MLENSNFATTKTIYILENISDVNGELNKITAEADILRPIEHQIENNQHQIIESSQENEFYTNDILGDSP